MKVLVCGGRTFSDKELLFAVLDEEHEKYNFDTLIHGGAKGADMLAHKWCCRNGIIEVCYPANWSKYGPAAGPIRNKKMLEEGKPDLVIAFPGGRGTANMVSLAKQAGIKVKVVET